MSTLASSPRLNRFAPYVLRYPHTGDPHGWNSLVSTTSGLLYEVNQGTFLGNYIFDFAGNQVKVVETPRSPQDHPAKSPRPSRIGKVKLPGTAILTITVVPNGM